MPVAESVEKNSLFLVKHQAAGDYIVKSLFAPGEGDDDEAYKKGEDGDDFCKEPERGPGKCYPVSVHVCHGDSECDLAQGGLVFRTLQVTKIQPWHDDE